MATISACITTPSVARATLVQKSSAVHRPMAVLGLPTMSKNNGRVSCSIKKEAEQPKSSSSGLAAVAAAAFAAAMSSPSAMALVDERMSTEGTGLPFGLSNNLLGWILLGVFALIWAFYTVYTSTLDEDEESGLSL